MALAQGDGGQIAELHAAGGRSLGRLRRERSPLSCTPLSREARSGQTSLGSLRLVSSVPFEDDIDGALSLGFDLPVPEPSLQVHVEIDLA